ncbi:glutamate-5-semialdehyde dehydrogenase [Maribacter polysaccharolyticus]|uniref:glutamate-5-semialdehyde dehydrogenase n=1 Tax=Maribacter polysaccharolyticus TaxID=3020831 RepID=UPI00237F1F4A|nr:glutamate-5-semialdehyde dehydrogenase [Maribacter polysaccharolyticus]MDE3742915.1 glutamate-5-semialdehyde dehydrogenase [Maribacter polysaccharolyticus]
MSLLLNIEQRNAVLNSMIKWLEKEKETLLKANTKDMDGYKGDDLAMYDRLKVDDNKIEGMVRSLQELEQQEDPLNKERFHFEHGNGMSVSNRTAPFGTVLIIYESRPDVTIEAAGIAFKSGNKIVLKGGKESLNSNLVLVDLWHKALQENQISTSWVTYLQYDRSETQAFLENPTQKLDLIVPRGGEKLIAFVKQHATCPVIVSGRGNNFVFVDVDADQDMAIDIIINAKTTKISACNALDKVLIHEQLPNKSVFLDTLTKKLLESKVTIWVDGHLNGLANTSLIANEAIWYEEFLDYKILLGEVKDLKEAMVKINKYGGGHSAAIITKNDSSATEFMNGVDTAAVYHNASTRFTDGGQFGLGGELAISTDKLHQRGPIGLQHLVTNKWYIKGNGQVR